jgi:hypothetical protein
MQSPTLGTIKRLFALSGNRCAHPQCAWPIVDPSGAVVGNVCHIRGERPGSARHDPAQSPEQRAGYENLILFCKNHHAMVDGCPATYTVDLLLEMKAMHERHGGIELSESDARMAEALYASITVTVHAGRDSQVMVASHGSVQAHSIESLTIKSQSRKAPSVAPTSGSIGHDLHMRNYVLHLIERYNEFQKWDTAKAGRGKYIVIGNAIKRRFGMKWDFVPQSRFEELVSYLQERILGSKLGRINNARGRRCFSTWAEWLREQQGHSATSGEADAAGL